MSKENELINVEPVQGEKEKQMEEANQVLSDEVGMGFGLDQVMYYGFNLRKEKNKEVE